MPGIFDLYGGPQFGIKDLKVATWVGDGTWGTAADVPSVSRLSVTLQTQSGELTGDDEITAVHSKIIGGQFQMTYGSFSMNAMDVITGEASTSSGGDRAQAFGNKNFPYFGICAQVEAVEGVGDMWIFIPKAKIQEGFTAMFQYNQFTIPEINGRFLIDKVYVVNSDPKALVFIEHTTAASISSFPPSYPVSAVA